MDEIHSRLPVGNSQSEFSSSPLSAPATTRCEACALATAVDVTAGGASHTSHKTYYLHRGRLKKPILEVVPIAPALSNCVATLACQRRPT